MNSIKVTYQELITAANNVDDKAADYYKTYTELLSGVETLTTSGWTGEDATAFRDQINGFEDDFSNMKKLMNNYATFLRDAAKNYQDTQEELITQIKSLQN